MTVGAATPGRRILVQIDPEEQARRLAPAAAPKPAPSIGSGTAPADAADQLATAAIGRFGRFWEIVSPAAADSGPGRLPAAIAALDAGAGVAGPSLDNLRALAARHGAHLLLHSVGTQVSPALALSVLAVESGGNATALSRAGAQGLMQLMPATAEEVGVSDRSDPSENIRGGIAYLDGLMHRFARDPVLVLAAYNAGPGAVERHGGVPPFAETRDYVPKVLAAWKVARLLCQTPPELVSDGCVFARAGG